MSILPRCNQADVDELQYLACLYGFRRNQAGRARLDIAAEHASSSNATGRRLSVSSHAKCGHFGPNVTASAHQAIEKQSADVAAHATTDAIHPCRQRRLRQNPRVCQHQPRAGSASAREASSRSPPVRQEKSRTTSIQSLGLPDRCLQVVGVDARHADGMIGTVLNGIGERRCRKSASHRQQAINRLDRACRAPQADRHALPAPIPREPGRAFFLRRLGDRRPLARLPDGLVVGARVDGLPAKRKWWLQQRRMPRKPKQSSLLSCRSPG